MHLNENLSIICVNNNGLPGFVFWYFISQGIFIKPAYGILELLIVNF